MRTLPCRVIPLPGETRAGFLARLAVVNSLDLSALTHYLERTVGANRSSSTNARFTSATEAIGALPPGYFAKERARFRLYRRCHHVRWMLRRCATCEVVDRARSACLVCSDGNPTEVFSRGGGFCIRHRRWHFLGEDELLSTPSACHRAEQSISGILWRRGVTMHTGEYGLALRLIIDSWQERPDARWLRVSCSYAPAVDLLVTLTHPDVALSLFALAESDSQQVEGLIGLVVGIGGGSRTAELESTAATVVAVHRAAMYTAIRMPKSSGATVSKTPFEKGLAEASYREKAVLLRHVTRSGRRADIEERAVRAAPASRVVSRRIVPGWADDAPWVTQGTEQRSATSKIGSVPRHQIGQGDAEHLGESQESSQRGVSRVAGA